MNLWIILGLMSLGAIAFAVWPLYRNERRLSLLSAAAVVFVVALSTGLYYQQGSPGLPSGDATAAEQSMEDAIAGLAARLAENPDDPDGWMMLGRSYLSTQNFPAAVDAFEKAVELESAQNPQALVGLGEALLANSEGQWDGRTVALFENALAIDPDFPQALFYGGIAAFNRDDVNLAADRWERLLALNPPPEIQGILRQRIAEWRGEAPQMPPSHPPIDGSAPAASAATQPAAAGDLPPMSDGAVVRANVTLSPEAIRALPTQATVFVIARDPSQPGPPIAVARRQLSELPALVELGDRESMVPGRNLSAFPEFELLARVSLSGQPTAQPGDWFGTAIVTPATDNDIELSISQQVE